MDIRSFDETKLKKLNSATKYPSILTYHELGDKGRLTETVQVPFDGDATITEKVDGTNVRIVFFPRSDTYIIGSRDEFLHARRDLIANPSLGIVEGVKVYAERSLSLGFAADSFFMIFGELYGGRIGGSARAYTESGQVGFRVFDVATINIAHFEQMLGTMTIEQIASWRDKGGQYFLGESWIVNTAQEINARVTPRLGLEAAMPTSISDTYDWLKAQLPGNSEAVLDGAGGKPEGVVVRNGDRTKIAKIRFEDYERTLRSKPSP